MLPGIPGRYIAAGPLASRWLQQVFATDATLVQSGAVILGEPAAGYVSHEGYAALAQAPLSLPGNAWCYLAGESVPLAETG